MVIEQISDTSTLDKCQLNVHLTEKPQSFLTTLPLQDVVMAITVTEVNTGKQEVHALKNTTINLKGKFERD